MVITDPPYGVKKKYKSYDDTEISLTEMINFVLPELQKQTNRILITCGIGNIWKYPPADWVLCWWKPNAMTRSMVANANVWEPVLVYGCKGFDRDGITAPIIPHSFKHPCPKPIKLFSWLIEKASFPEDIIIDPFMGSGTLLFAAKSFNRYAIGIEIEEKYCEIAAKRLSQEVFNFAG